MKRFAIVDTDGHHADVNRDILDQAVELMEACVKPWQR